MKKISGFILFVLILSSCDKPRKACYSYSPANIVANSNVIFDASCSEGAYSYSWDFGDGTITSTTSALINHQYSNPGTYSVLLTAERKDGVTFRKEEPTSTQIIVVQ